MRKSVSSYIKSFTQRALFSFEQFSRHEMANHAAAGAYSFLLSAIPAVLVILYLSSIAAVNINAEELIEAVGPYIDAFDGRAALQSFFTKPLAGFTGAFGLVNLIWAARLFIVSLQRGIRVVYADAAKVNPVRDNVLTFAVELIVMVAIVFIISVSQIAIAALDAIRWAPAAAFFGYAVRIAIHALPLLSLWLFVFLTYENVSSHKPKIINAIVSSVLCIISYTILGEIFRLTLNMARYGLLYGILGNLIVGLIKVYFFFWLYYFYAELTYTMEFFDSLLFARFHRLSSSEKAATKIERALFSEPNRLFKRYAREFRAGQIIFAKGDDERSAMYLYRGTVDVYLSQPVSQDEPDTGEQRNAPLSLVNEGEFFGEMAWILEEPRSAWAVAKTDCTVFVLPPTLFERFLAQDADASRRLTEVLAARLRANNAILSAAETR